MHVVTDAASEVVEAKSLADLGLQDRNILVIGPNASGKTRTALPWIVSSYLESQTGVYLGVQLGGEPTLEVFEKHVDGFALGNPSSMVGHVIGRLQARHAGVENPVPLALVLDNADGYGLTDEIMYLASNGPKYGIHVVAAAPCTQHWLPGTAISVFDGRIVMAPDRLHWVALALALPGLRVSRDDPRTWAGLDRDTALVSSQSLGRPRLVRLLT